MTSQCFPEEVRAVRHAGQAPAAPFDADIACWQNVQRSAAINLSP
jgi:hypothetical protein